MSKIIIKQYYLNFKDNKIYDYLVIAEKEKLHEKLPEPYLRVLFEKFSDSFTKNIYIIFGSTVDQIQNPRSLDCFRHSIYGYDS